MKRVVRVAAALMFAVVGIGPVVERDVFAAGGPPMLTDDPGTVDGGDWEINVAWIGERSANAREDETPLVDVNYGLTENVQVKFEMPWISDSGRSNNGFGAANAGVKWRFFDQGEGGWQVATYPQIEFLVPGLHHAGSDESGPRRLLPIEVQRDFGGFDAGAEIGRTFVPESRDDGWIAGITVGRKVSEHLELIGELHDETVGGADTHELVLNIGARQTLSEHFTLLVSLGGDIENTIEPRNRWISYLGLQVHL